MIASIRICGQDKDISLNLKPKADELGLSEANIIKQFQESFDAGRSAADAWGS